MRIKLEQLSQHLQKQIAPLYTIFGNEPLFIIEATDLIRAHAHKQGYYNREIFTIDQHFNWSDLQYAGNSPSLFGERKILDLRIPSGKPGREGSKALIEYCHTLPPDAVTLITLPKIDKQSQSTKWFKALEHVGLTIAVYPIDRAQLPTWIKQRLNLQQQKLDTDTLQFLADKVEGNLLAAHQEIQKLALLYPAGMLSFDQVKNVVLNVARYDIYKLSEAMITANITRYTRILTGLQAEGTALPLIITVLAEQIRTLIFISKGLKTGKPPAQLMKEARIWGERQKPTITAAKLTGLQSLTHILLHIAKIDRISKGITKGDAWNELSQLGLYFIIQQK